jgi:GTP cyclohydrolase I
MLKKIRRITASILFLLLTLLFLDFTGTFHVWFGWMAKIQLVPAILATNIVVILSLIVPTLLFGRIYCSVVCPLGVFQDGVSNISGRRKGKKNRFRYSVAKSWLRYGVLALFIIATIAGISVVVSLLDPYAGYGRIASNFFAPLYRMGNNILALIAERADSYAFYSTDIWIKGWIIFGVAAITTIIIGVLAWLHGRTYCNTICPVGTFLGLLSKFSLFRLTFDEEKCTKCKACERGHRGFVDAHSERTVLGEDVSREGLIKTPDRVAKAMQYLTKGYWQSPEEILRSAQFKENYRQMVIVKDIDFFSMCEHHMLPFFGKAHVAYIPNGFVTGLSKIARVVDVFSRRLQVQERLTTQIKDCIQNTLNPMGVMVVIEAKHMCMQMRGVEKQNSITTTSDFTGIFREQKTREEFVNLINRK